MHWLTLIVLLFTLNTHSPYNLLALIKVFVNLEAQYIYIEYTAIYRI